MKYPVGQRVRIVAIPTPLHPANALGAETMITHIVTTPAGNEAYQLMGFSEEVKFMGFTCILCWGDEHVEPILGGMDFVEEEEQECEMA